MSNAFTQLRTTLAADLAVVGVPVHDTEPAAIDAPCVILDAPPVGDYIAGGKNFGEYVLSLDVMVLVDDTSPDADALAALEELLAGVLTNSEDWAFLGIDRPGLLRFAATDQDFFGTVVHLRKTTRL